VSPSRPTPTPTSTVTPTISITPTITPSVTPTKTPTPSVTKTPGVTPTQSPTPSVTRTPTPTVTQTRNIYFRLSACCPFPGAFGNDLINYIPYTDFNTWANVNILYNNNQSGTGIPPVTTFLFFVPLQDPTFNQGGAIAFYIDSVAANREIASTGLGYDDRYSGTSFGVATANRVDINGIPVISQIFFSDSTGQPFIFPNAGSINYVIYK
jgi:hypothetical protein